MAECIDRQAAIEAIDEGFPAAPASEFSRGVAVGIAMARLAVCNLPAADVRPVRRGKWSRVYDDFMKSNYDTCSCCGKEYFGANGFNFCPNCGAAMEES